MRGKGSSSSRGEEESGTLFALEDKTSGDGFRGVSHILREPAGLCCSSNHYEQTFLEEYGPPIDSRNANAQCATQSSIFQAASTPTSFSVRA